jgi:oligoendopeptidase F
MIVDQPTQWTLQDLLPEPDGLALHDHLARLESLVGMIQAARPNLTAEITPAMFFDILGWVEELTAITARVGAFTYLWLAEDTQNQAALNLKGRMDQMLTDASTRILFFNLWFKELPEAAAQRLIDAAGDLRYTLVTMRRFKPHTLDETSEQLIQLKDVNGIDALVNLYEMLTNRFSFHLSVDGETKTLTRDQLSRYFRHPSAELRAAAYQELNRVYAEHAPILAQLYTHRVRDWHTEGITLRHYASPIAARNLTNDLPDGIVDALLAACRRNAGVFQDYFRLKAGWLGVEKLRRCDIYAPLAQSEKRYAYAQAVEMVLDSFQDFSAEMSDQARRVFAEEHLDSQVRPGKRGGAFCYAALPKLTPWVMVNFNGRASDIATLAHELGHAVHAMQAAGHSPLNFRAPLPLAETASVFCEMLLTDRLLQQEQDLSVRRDLLVGAIDNAYATVIRQSYFTLFEIDAHQMLAAGETVDALWDLYLTGLVEQFGDAVDVGEDFRWEWTMIPHIYRVPFYPYAYSFGQLLVLALYRQYKSEGKSFVPRYLRLLSYGGSQAPMIILQEAGIDIASPAFWDGGFDVLREMIEQLKKLQQGSF